MEAIPIIQLVGWAVTIITALGVAFLSNSLNKSSKAVEAEKKANEERDRKIAEMEKSLIKAENTFVTNAELKIAIQEAFEPYKEDQKEIKLMLRMLTEELGGISRDIAIINAIGRSNGRSGHNGSDGGGHN